MKDSHWILYPKQEAGIAFCSPVAAAASGSAWEAHLPRPQHLSRRKEFAPCFTPHYSVANTSTKNGGGIYTQQLGTTVGKVTCFDSTQITGNSDSGGGGAGVFVNVGGDFIMDGGNIAYNYEMSPGNGGGLYNAAGGTVDLEEGVTVQNNTAFGYGGGMYLANSSTTTLNNVTVQNNKLDPTQGKGGVGIYYQNNAALTWTGLTDKDDPKGNPVQGV